VSRLGAASAPLTELLAGKRLVVLVGQGGVGKTSVSAAIAWARAEAGERVAVLTIDPAPRLGDALGLASIDAEPQRVALPAAVRGTLTAMRLDTRRTFDRMISQHAPSPETAARLLAHPLYRSIANQLGGTESYMAFQRLHELDAAGGHDCLVVDTPPAVNAAQLLAAPARLTGLLDTGALSVLADPSRVLTRAARRSPAR
jgi:arsenite-transporting ATPase